MDVYTNQREESQFSGRKECDWKEKPQHSSVMLQ